MQQHNLNAVAREWHERELLELDYEQLDTFHRSVKGCLFLGQRLGLLPLVHTLHANPEHLQFKLKSITMLITLIFLCCGSMKAFYHTTLLLINGINSKNIMGLFFFYTNLSICVCFLLLARQWPRLAQYWTHIELRFLRPPYTSVCKCMPLHTKLPLFSIIFISIALVEHSLYYASEYTNFHMKAMHCTPQNQTHNNSMFHQFIEQKYADILKILPFNALTVFYGFYFNANFNLIWNFSDLFIMLVSMALARRFHQHAKYVQMLEQHHAPLHLWQQARKDHVRLCELLEYVDEHLSHFVVISAFNNTYFICNALLNIFTKLRWTVNYVYFWFSLLFMLARTSSVFLCAATITETAHLPLQTLYLIKRDRWNVEADRLTEQITSGAIALTGQRFFNVTRQNFFGLMASIVTWELMLLQLDAPNWQAGLPDLCI